LRPHHDTAAAQVPACLRQTRRGELWNWGAPTSEPDRTEAVKKIVIYLPIPTIASLRMVQGTETK